MVIYNSHIFSKCSNFLLAIQKLKTFQTLVLYVHLYLKVFNGMLKSICINLDTILQKLHLCFISVFKLVMVM